MWSDEVDIIIIKWDVGLSFNFYMVSDGIDTVLRFSSSFFGVCVHSNVMYILSV